MITVPEAARLVGRDPETIRRWIRAGKLTAWKIGTQHVIDEDDLTNVVRGRIARIGAAARLVLFGARARKPARDDSDYDLLVVVDEVSNRREARIGIRRGLARLPRSVTPPPSTADEIAGSPRR